MKKIFILIALIAVTTGCTKGEEFTCTVDGKEAIFTLKNGIVTNYTLDGEKVDQSTIDEINGEHFTSATTNEEGKEALNRYMLSVNGSCN